MYTQSLNIKLFDSDYTFSAQSRTIYSFTSSNPLLSFTCFIPPPYSIPIHADLSTQTPKDLHIVKPFDICLIDPPWSMTTKSPTRGLTISYSQLSDSSLLQIPLDLWCNGIIWMWSFSSKLEVAISWLHKYNFFIVDTLTWVKASNDNVLQFSQGFYMKHGTEVCIVAKHHHFTVNFRKGVIEDILVDKSIKVKNQSRFMKSLRIFHQHHLPTVNCLEGNTT